MLTSYDVTADNDVDNGIYRAQSQVANCGVSVGFYWLFRNATFVSPGPGQNPVKIPIHLSGPLRLLLCENSFLAVYHVET